MRSDGTLNALPGEIAIHGVADERLVLQTLVAAHHELTEAMRDQASQLRALLLRGDNAVRALGRSGLGQGILTTLAHRPLPRKTTDRQAARHPDIQRLANVLLAYRDKLCANREQLTPIVNELVPGVTTQHGIGPLKAAKAILNSTEDTAPLR